MNLPYLIPEFPGIGGVIKERPEDFFVQELPLYEASGQGEHVYCEIQKTGLTTFHAIDDIARALNVSPRDIGYAGMKDAHSISRQLFSIWGTTPEAVMALTIPNIKVQWAARHGNKLRLGHLLGNRFAIKIRQVNPTDIVKLTPVLQQLQDRGIPNYFGEQRFGHRGDNDQVGAAIVRGDDKAVISLLLGTPRPNVDDPATVRARRAVDSGDLELAMKIYPRHCGMERRVLARLIKTHKPSAAARLIDQRLRRLWVSALQSSLFNQVVAARINSLDKLMVGDLAYKHDNGAVFSVEDAAVEQPRADRFEISPTGPLVGYRLTLPQAEPLNIEQAAMDAVGLKPADFRVEGRLRVKGARRPLRAKPADVECSSGVDEVGSYIAVAFTLPAGTFATVLLRELMKSEAAPAKTPAESAEPEESEAPVGSDPSESEPSESEGD
ncbi:MAG: tRNA pseudouridine(13) synthase TruD [Tepidisphaeraceae bacterium]|jgi:tRNA pseudouridine13 synthase